VKASRLQALGSFEKHRELGNGKFRLERISHVVDNFESCGDYTKGIASIQPFGDFLRPNAHWHALVLEEGFSPDGRFLFLRIQNTQKLTEIFRRALITEEFASTLCSFPMKVLALITDPQQCRRILLHLAELIILFPLPLPGRCLVVPKDRTAPSEAPDCTITPPGAGFPNGRGFDSRTDGSECSGPGHSPPLPRTVPREERIIVTANCSIAVCSYN
jgi:hypothetical protein